MITKEQLRIYEAFRGDLDMWVRAGSEHDRTVMSDADWRQIDQLLGEVSLLDRDLTSEDFARRVQASLRENTVDETVAARLREMAAKVDRPKGW